MVWYHRSRISQICDARAASCFRRSPCISPTGGYVFCIRCPEGENESVLSGIFFALYWCSSLYDVRTEIDDTVFGLEQAYSVLLYDFLES